jgi:ABC-type transporter Mla subunit MlaD
MKLDASSLELIRRETLEKAADDLRRAANQLEHLSEFVRPPLSRDVEDIRTSVALARGSLEVIDKVGWPGEG